MNVQSQKSVPSNTKVSVDDLVFREITRDAPLHDPNAFLNKGALISKEAVHPFGGDATDKISEINANRLAHSQNDESIWDKHCYGLFDKHGKPKIAVYVKLLHIEPDANGSIPSNRLPGDIQAILNEPGKPVENPNTAIFYTITRLSRDEVKPVPNSAQTAPSVSSGEKLIQQVAGHLAKAYGIKAFSTLSPMRSGMGKGAKGFADWLDQRLEDVKIGSNKSPSILTHTEEKKLRGYAEATVDETNGAALQRLLSVRDTLPDEQQTFLTRLMEDLGVYYIAHERKMNNRSLPLDDVTKFHIGNGAELANIHFLSPKQSTESDQKGALGMMANYRYYPHLLNARKSNFKNENIVRLSPALAERYDHRLQQLDKALPLPSSRHSFEPANDASFRMKVNATSNRVPNPFPVTTAHGNFALLHSAQRQPYATLCNRIDRSTAPSH